MCRPLNRVLGQLWAAIGLELNAQVRTTIVPTHVSMGVAHNVVPSTATLRLDARLLQGDDDKDLALRHVRRMAASTRRDHDTTLLIEPDESSPVTFQAPSNVRIHVLKLFLRARRDLPGAPLDPCAWRKGLIATQAELNASVPLCLRSQHVIMWTSAVYHRQ